MFKSLIAASVAAVCIFGLALPAHADPITSAGDIDNPIVIDFSQFNSGFEFTAGPKQIGGLVAEDVTWQSTSSSSVIGNGGYGLGANGSWTSAKTYVGSNSNTATMRFTFNDGPVAAVGGFVNYSINTDSPADFFIRVYDSSDVLLESFNVRQDAPISTPGGINEGAFRGIKLDTASIAYVELQGAFDVLDDLTFSRSAVPEPSTLALLGLGLGAVVIRRRRRRR